MKYLQRLLQQFSGAMMTPIILLVLVGFYVGIGSSFVNYLLVSDSIFKTIFQMLVQMGFGFMQHLALYFAIGIAFSLAKKEKGYAALTAFMMFMCYIICIGVYAKSLGYSADTVKVEYLLKQGYTQLQALNFSALWTTYVGKFTLDMGIFSGIIIGLVVSYVHNKLCDIKFNDMFAFFQGCKFVMLVCSLLCIPLSIVTFYIWPIFASLLQHSAYFIANSGLFGTWFFGFIDKALLPFGLHHLIAFPLEYSRVGGQLVIDGTVYEGVRNIMVGQAASPNALGYITRNFTSGRILFQLAGLPGVGLAMYHLADKEQRKKVAAILIPSILTLALVGISEPIEYTFLFVAPLLYWLVYAPLCGLCYVVCEVFKISINGHALFFMIPNLFQLNKVYITPLIFLLPLTFIIYYFVFKFLIVKFNLKTPGRNAKAELISKKQYQALKEEKANDESLPNKILSAFGGASNIENIGCCATRLRVTVKDPKLVASDDYFTNQLEAIGVIKSDTSYQIIYGLRVNIITSQIKALLKID